MIKMQLYLYTGTSSSKKLTWIAASLQTAHSHAKSTHTAQNIRKWTRSFITDREDLPLNLYGAWNTSMLDKGELAKEIHEHLQGIGKFVKAQDIVNFLNTDEIKSRYTLKKTISLATAQRWMHLMDYRWSKGPSGQYVDGHEREDVVAYHQEKFLPTMAELEWNLRVWKDGVEEICETAPRPRPRRVVIWWHDESTFYANDRRLVYWVHENKKAVPRPKGEGASLMVADFVSADYGWMRFGDEEGRVLFKAGKARDGYFTNDDIVAHVEKAMDLLQKHLPQEDHVFIFDNATTHLKWADDALSARKMSKNPTRPENPFFGIDRNVIGPDGKPIYAPNGKFHKERVPMAEGRLPDGSPQSFYFPVGHPRAGVFKGMTIILEERGFKDVGKLNAECPKFQCPKGATSCCTRRLLYSQPDFVDVESRVETICKSRGFRAFFLPKFHCELNFIEQCWGHAKRTYRLNPPSSSEQDLEKNVLAALDAVPLATMRRFATRSLRFMDAYRKGLTGKQAMWAAKKYRGHRVLPASIFLELAQSEAHPSKK
ncbi:hypothetical protein JAAARDRAFT_185917 [Jaapia argillacea MUCL 33604]|uniref:Uncharacterized protein n=1 Tax=Jaapia argillacea MUCL 33604 TaxID=933084 RepID=A0A067P7F1_9AGAM|nr:hypothetical protein JAAARDRAFT_185917 [Jaapia argillacea MUCL 33604]